MTLDQILGIALTAVLAAWLLRTAPDAPRPRHRMFLVWHPERFKPLLVRPWNEHIGWWADHLSAERVGFDQPIEFTKSVANDWEAAIMGTVHKS